MNRRRVMMTRRVMMRTRRVMMRRMMMVISSILAKLCTAYYFVPVDLAVLKRTNVMSIPSSMMPI